MAFTIHEAGTLEFPNGERGILKNNRNGATD
jgi:hypothetical protein